MLGPPVERRKGIIEQPSSFSSGQAAPGEKKSDVPRRYEPRGHRPASRTRRSTPRRRVGGPRARNDTTPKGTERHRPRRRRSRVSPASEAAALREARVVVHTAPRARERCGAARRLLGPTQFHGLATAARVVTSTTYATSARAHDYRHHARIPGDGQRSSPTGGAKFRARLS